MLRSGSQRPRPAASMVEAAILLPVCLVLVLATLDLGLLVFRYHLVAEAARQLARQAIVHGARAPSGMGCWGPNSVDSASLSSGDPVWEAIRSSLVGLPVEETHAQIDWIDGSNEPEARVRVTVACAYQPMLTLVFGQGPLPVRAASTMPIAH